MPTQGSITKTIRINPKDLEVIERLMEDGTSWSGAIHKLCESERGVPINVVQNEESEYMRRLKMDAAPFGMTAEELGGKLLDGMDSGEIMYENGEFRGNNECAQLIEACRDKGVPLEKIMDRCIQMVRMM